ncbi:MAG: hypothetical protein ACOH5I_13195 [Oligoflexus sp.]
MLQRKYAHSWITLTFMLLSQLACSPSNEIRGFYQQSKEEASTDLQVKQKSSSDRPSEEGVGLPGYIMSCAIDKVEESQLEVGCQIAEEESQQRVKLPAGEWQKFTVTTPENIPGLNIEKRAAEVASDWDALFTFSGLQQSELIEAAMQSSYSFEWQHENGETESLLAEPPEQDTLQPINSETSINQCSSGVSVNGVCFFRSSRSCNSSCENMNSTVHEAWFTSFGSANQDGDASCRNIYENLNSGPSIFFQSRTMFTLGYGCYDNGRASIIHEAGATELDPSRFPPIGGSVICACNSI